MNATETMLAQATLGPSAAAWIGPGMALACAAVAARRSGLPGEEPRPGGIAPVLIGLGAVAAACVSWANAGGVGASLCIASGAGFAAALLGALLARRFGANAEVLLGAVMLAWAGALVMVATRIGVDAEPRAVVPAALTMAAASLGGLLGCARCGAAGAGMIGAGVLIGAGLAVCGAFEVPHITESNRLNLALKLAGAVVLMGGAAAVCRLIGGKAGAFAGLGLLGGIGLAGSWWMVGSSPEISWLGLGAAPVVGGAAVIAASRLPRGLGVLVFTAVFAGVFALCGGVDLPLIGFAGAVLAGIGVIACEPARTSGPRLSAGAASVVTVAGALALVPVGALRAHEARAAGPSGEGDGLRAVYLGERRFRIINPVLGTTDAGLLIGMDQFDDPHDVDHLEPGMVIPASVEGDELEGRLVRLKARTKHGDHFHNYNFVVVASRFGNRGDALAFHRLSLDSAPVWVAAGAGVGVVMLAGLRRRGLAPAFAALGAIGAGAILGVGGAAGFAIGAGVSGLFRGAEEGAHPDAGPAAAVAALAGLGVATTFGPVAGAWLGVS